MILTVYIQAQKLIQIVRGQRLSRRILPKSKRKTLFVVFFSGRCNELDRFAFLTVKCHNPEKLSFQHIPVKIKVNKPYEKIGEKKIINLETVLYLTL